MALLFQSTTDNGDWWRDELQARLPGMDIRIWPDCGDVAEISYVLAWKPPHGELAKYPNLKAIFSLGAGVDHLFGDPDLPRHIPMTRVVDHNLTLRMTEYVVQHVLNHHRRQRELNAQQRSHKWEMLYTPAATERRVGILGLGELGRDAAEKLNSLGFDVAGWSRRDKEIDGVESFAGEEGLTPFLARTEILVCLLPLTNETEGILCARTLAMLPEGASLINAARGGHVVEEDLLAALESGQVSEATLDVFRTEPLPADSPFWSHPRVTVTPHQASITDPRSVADQVAENIRRLEAGEPLLNLVDTEKGY